MPCIHFRLHRTAGKSSTCNLCTKHDCSRHPFEWGSCIEGKDANAAEDICLTRTQRRLYRHRFAREMLQIVNMKNVG